MFQQMANLHSLGLNSSWPKSDVCVCGGGGGGGGGMEQENLAFDA